ncbi:YhdH/YhfP family quinone oxidoreductase [Vallitalea pronyensis]|uniref:YhdH/YhfP family quinone oxidoreductase n=1 Tax=Vallitalea pronyensis TaxID=1348613 RepID=A0A8J8SI74_9FIRM|nr:YhdH/YhfP family quinone oxidoreductase [Vallitalea pronyensis]QUI24311.1 YhdH/YhfP family quinone oxidoreductase [Vallitalea pronyensis]
MKQDKFKAMQIKEHENNTFTRSIVYRSVKDLPDGDVLIQVKYSSLNYKDALSATGNKGVTKIYPHTPGIDASGIVVESKTPAFKHGDEVLVTGYDLGMNTPGGYGQYIRVPADWVVLLPPNLSLKESQIYGTAGFTAGLSVNKIIESGIEPEDGELLVTGATGGVGSIAVRILSKLGYHVIASTGKSQQKVTLLDMGAKDIILREAIDDASGKALLKARWAGVIDVVGGNTLATAIKSTQYGGSVTCCGNIASHKFTTSVYPFILRGVSLFGIDSGICPMPLRRKIWNLLANEWKPNNLDIDTEVIALEELDIKIDRILQGKNKGRTLVDMQM